MAIGIIPRNGEPSRCEIRVELDHNVPLEYHRYDIYSTLRSHGVRHAARGRSGRFGFPGTERVLKRRNKTEVQVLHNVPRLICFGGRPSLTKQADAMQELGEREPHRVRQFQRRFNGRYAPPRLNLGERRTGDSRSFRPQSDLVLAPHAKPLDQFRETFGGPPIWKVVVREMRGRQQDAITYYGFGFSRIR
jgi:hypothetical protein